MLSLSMIVRDEAERLERCLASVQGFVDEMVLVDTGSQDGTVALAKSLGATVQEIPWPGDFAPARNTALQGLKGDWVLVLDGDEQLRAEAMAPLRALMAQPDVLLINLLRLEVGARQSPYSSVSRLFRRHPAIRWSRAYHSSVDESVAELQLKEPQWRVANCGVPALLHDGYRPELLAQGSKAQRLREAMEQELQERPNDAYACAKLGSLEVSEGHRAKGIALLRMGLEHCPPQAHPERYELLLHLAIATAEADPGGATGLYRQALALPLPQRLSLGARLNLGLVSRRNGDLVGALEAYGQARRLNPEHAETHQNLAVAELLAGDIAASRASFRQAIALLHSQGRASEAAHLRQQAGAMVQLES